MKLKYYLRGMGIGIILTAIVMGFALGGRKATISDAEVIERAKTLGMVDPNSGVLSQTLSGADNYEEANTVASGQELDQKREEISEEINQIFASASESVSGLDEEAAEGEGENKASQGESGEKTEEDVKNKIVDTVKPEENVDAKPERSPEGLAASQNEASQKNSQEAETAVAEEVQNMNKSEESADAASSEKTTVEDNKKAESTENPVSNNTSTNNTSTKVTGKTLTIPKGMSSDSVAELLYQKGFVDSARSFNQYLIDKRMDRIIRSGDKVIPDGASYEEIANIICK